MSDISPSAQRRAQKTAALHRRPEQRPCYLARRIVRSVEIRFPLPPATGSSFSLVVGRGRIATPRYLAWRAQAVMQISFAKPMPGRIAGPCDVAIHLPPSSGKPEHRKQACLDAAVAAGVIAGADDDFIRTISIVAAPDAPDVRMVLTSAPVDEADAAEIELRAQQGQSPEYIASILSGLSLGQVETVLAEAAERRRAPALIASKSKRGRRAVS